jgi:hypothetical protein
VKTTFTSPAALYVALRDAIADAGPTPCQLDDELDRRWFVEVVQERGRAQAAAEAAQEVVDACRGCAVVDLCLRYAHASHERDGVWGATTPEERAALLAAQPTTAA